MRIFPAVHYSMGGMWTQYVRGSYKPAEPRPEHIPGQTPPTGTEPGIGMQVGATHNMMTNIEGLYAFGEVNFAYHGATRLGANALLSCIFDGLFCGLGVANYVKDGVEDGARAAGLPASVYDDAVAAEKEKMDRLIGTVPADGPSLDEDTNPYVIGRELGEEMNAACTVVKTGERLAKTLEKIAELKERFTRVRLADNAMWTNQSLSYTRAVGDMIVLAELIAKTSLLREESRGSHYRLDCPDRDDERFLKTTVAEYAPDDPDATRVTYRDVDTRLVRLRARTYGKTAEQQAKDKPAKEAVGAS
jgi:succinate dehydrogenase / fumarate reductase flavoprotein subunit